MTEDESMYVVRDGSRQLKFDGEKLAESSSRNRHNVRWVEFQLYRTAGGQYVLARVGVSLYYHRSSCAVVSRNKIAAVPTEEVSTALVACHDCAPNPLLEDELFPEQPRYWAQVGDTAEGVIHALEKFDDDGNVYLTNVARRLLEDAARIDDGIYQAYYEQVID